MNKIFKVKFNVRTGVYAVVSELITNKKKKSEQGAASTPSLLARTLPLLACGLLSAAPASSAPQAGSYNNDVVAGVDLHMEDNKKIDLENWDQVYWYLKTVRPNAVVVRGVENYVFVGKSKNDHYSLGNWGGSVLGSYNRLGQNKSSIVGLSNVIEGSDFSNPNTRVHLLANGLVERQSNGNFVTNDSFPDAPSHPKVIDFIAGSSVVGLKNAVLENSFGAQALGSYNAIGMQTGFANTIGAFNVVGDKSDFVTTLGARNKVDQRNATTLLSGYNNTTGQETTDTYVTGGSNTLGKKNAKINLYGQRNTLQNGIEKLNVFGSDNTVESDANQSSNTFASTLLGDGNTLKAGSHDNTILGSSNTIDRISQKVFVSGRSNTVGVNNSNVTFVGLTNTAGANNQNIYFFGEGNKASNGANTIYAFGRGNTVGDRASLSLLIGNNNAAGDGAQQSVLTGMQNTVNGVQTAVLTGVNNTATGGNWASDFALYGMNNSINSAMDARSVTLNGVSNSISSANDAEFMTVNGTNNRITDAAQTQHWAIFGSENALSSLTGAKNLTLNGVKNSISSAASAEFMTVNGTSNRITDAAKTQHLAILGSENALSSLTGAKNLTLNGVKNSISSAANAEFMTVNGTSNTITNAAKTQHLAIFGSENTLSSVNNAHHLSLHGMTNSIETAAGSDKVSLNGVDNHIRQRVSNINISGVDNVITTHPTGDNFLVHNVNMMGTGLRLVDRKTAFGSGNAQTAERNHNIPANILNYGNNPAGQRLGNVTMIGHDVSVATDSPESTVIGNHINTVSSTQNVGDKKHHTAGQYVAIGNHLGGENAPLVFGRGAIALGTHISGVVGTDSIAIGTNSSSNNWAAVAIGSGAKTGVDTTTPVWGGTYPGDTAVAIGNDTRAEAWMSLAIGYQARTKSRGAGIPHSTVSLGYNALSEGQGNVALGSRTYTDLEGLNFTSGGLKNLKDIQRGDTEKDRIAMLWYDPVKTEVTDVNLKPKSILSVGLTKKDALSEEGLEPTPRSTMELRRIQGLAAGLIDPNSTDAVTGAQFYGLSKLLDDRTQPMTLSGKANGTAVPGFTLESKDALSLETDENLTLTMADKTAATDKKIALGLSRNLSVDSLTLGTAGKTVRLATDATGNAILDATGKTVNLKAQNLSFDTNAGLLNGDMTAGTGAHSDTTLTFGAGSTPLSLTAAAGAASPVGVVNLDNRRLQGLVAGKVSADSTDAVIGSQLYRVAEALNTKIDNHKSGATFKISSGVAGSQEGTIDDSTKKLTLQGSNNVAVKLNVDTPTDPQFTFDLSENISVKTLEVGDANKVKLTTDAEGNLTTNNGKGVALANGADTSKLATTGLTVESGAEKTSVTKDAIKVANGADSSELKKDGVHTTNGTNSSDLGADKLTIAGANGANPKVELGTEALTFTGAGGHSAGIGLVDAAEALLLKGKNVLFGGADAVDTSDKTLAAKAYANDPIAFGNGKTLAVDVPAGSAAPAGVVNFNDRRLQGLAAGKVSADSTDAVNGSQVFGIAKSLNTKIEENSTFYKLSDGSATEGDINHSTKKLTVKGDNNVKVALKLDNATEPEFDLSLSDDLSVKTLEVGDAHKVKLTTDDEGNLTTEDGKGVALKNGADTSKLAPTGLDVTDGADKASVTKDAIKVANGADSSELKKDGVHTTNGTNSSILGADKLTIAGTNGANPKVELGADGLNFTSANNKTAGISLSDAADALLLKGKNMLFGEATQVATGNQTLADAAYTDTALNLDTGKTLNIATPAGSGTPKGVVNFDDRRLQGVSAGLVTAESTDAINGSQLFGVTKALNEKIEGSTTTFKLSNGVAGAAEGDINHDTTKLTLKGDKNVSVALNTGTATEPEFALSLSDNLSVKTLEVGDANKVKLTTDAEGNLTTEDGKGVALTQGADSSKLDPTGLTVKNGNDEASVKKDAIKVANGADSSELTKAGLAIKGDNGKAANLTANALTLAGAAGKTLSLTSDTTGNGAIKLADPNATLGLNAKNLSMAADSGLLTGDMTAGDTAYNPTSLTLGTRTLAIDSPAGNTAPKGVVNFDNRRLQGVAAGKVSQESTDAINGSQLFGVTKALNDKIEGSTTTYALSDGNAGTGTINHDTTKLTVKGDDNVLVALDTTTTTTPQFNVTLSKTLSVESLSLEKDGHKATLSVDANDAIVTGGKTLSVADGADTTTVEKDGLTVKNGDDVASVKKDAIKVANGDNTSELKKDGVHTTNGTNSSTLGADKLTIAGTNGANPKVELDANGLNFTSAGGKTAGIGLADGADALLLKGKNVLFGGANAVDTSDKTLAAEAYTNTPIAFGNGKNLTVDTPAGSAAPAGVVNFDNRRLQGVAAGKVSQESTDAINGSQLFGVAKALSEQVASSTLPIHVSGMNDKTATGTFDLGSDAKLAFTTDANLGLTVTAAANAQDPNTVALKLNDNLSVGTIEVGNTGNAADKKVKLSVDTNGNLTTDDGKGLALAKDGNETHVATTGLNVKNGDDEASVSKDAIKVANGADSSELKKDGLHTKSATNTSDLTADKLTIAGTNGADPKVELGTDALTFTKAGKTAGIGLSDTAEALLLKGKNMLFGDATGIANGPETLAGEGYTDTSIALDGGKTLAINLPAGNGAPKGVVNFDNRRLQGVAAGKVSKESTDAINGSQLFGVTQALNDKIEGSTTTYALSDGKTGSTEGTINHGTTKLTVKGDENVQVALDVTTATTPQFNVTLNKALSVETLTLGKAGHQATLSVDEHDTIQTGGKALAVADGADSTTVAKDGLTVKNGADEASVKKDAIKVANGDDSAELKKDGLTVAGAADKKSALSADGLTINGAAGKAITLKSDTTGNAILDAAGQTFNVKAKNFSMADDGSLLTGNMTAGDGAHTYTQLTFNSGTPLTVTAPAGAGAPAGVVNFANRRLQGLAAGLVSATSTDAINGSQLYGVAESLSAQITAGTRPIHVSGSNNGSALTGFDLGADAKLEFVTDKNVTLALEKAPDGSTDPNKVSLALNPKLSLESLELGNTGNAATDKPLTLSVDAEGNLTTDKGQGIALAKDGNTTTVAPTGVTSKTATNEAALTADKLALAGNQPTDAKAELTQKDLTFTGAQKADGSASTAGIGLADAADALVLKGKNVLFGDATDVATGAQTAGADALTDADKTLTFNNGKTLSLGDLPAGSTPKGVINADDRRIQGIAAGKVSAESTDAINGSQLYRVAEALAQQVNNTQTSFDLSDGTTQGTVNHDTTSLTFKGDDNVKVTLKTNPGATPEFDFALASDIKVGTVTVGDTGVAGAKTVKLSVNTEGNLTTDAGQGVAITKGNDTTSLLADGLHAKNQTASADLTAAGLAVKGENDKATTVDAGSMTLTGAAGKTVTLSADTDGNAHLQADNVALGTGATVTDAQALPDTVTVTDISTVTLKTDEMAGVTAAGVVSLGAANAERRLQNVAAGMISAQSTDAINGSQLFALAKEVAKIPVTKLDAKDNLTIGGTVGANAESTTALGKNTQTDGTGAVALGSGASAQGDGAVAIGQKAQAQGNGVALGDGAQATAGNVALGAGSSALERADLAPGVVGVVSVGNEANGETRIIAGVADGTRPTDAVNVRQMERFGQGVNQRITNLQDESRGGIASVAAMANLPPAFRPGQSGVTMGMGNFKGSSAIAIGATHMNERGDVVMKLSGSVSDNGDAVVGAGVGFYW